jgi:hypothetical protein
LPSTWNGNADLDEKVYRNRKRREAAAHIAELPKPSAAQSTLTAKQLTDALAEAAGMALFLAEKAIAKLAKRVAELEARPPFDYTGTFVTGRSYRKGQGCTFDGSIFVALRDYPGRPGTAGCGWQLAVKRGRDGRDGKVLKRHALA